MQFETTGNGPSLGLLGRVRYYVEGSVDGKTGWALINPAPTLMPPDIDDYLLDSTSNYRYFRVKAEITD